MSMVACVEHLAPALYIHCVYSMSTPQRLLHRHIWQLDYEVIYIYIT